MQRILICSLLCVCSASMVWGAPLPGFYDELRKDVTLLELEIIDDAEKHHTPMDVEEKCLFSALSCFINATSFLKPRKNNETLSRIQSVNQNIFHNASKQDCPRCTEYHKKSPKEFLGKFKRLLQQLYRLSVSS